MIRRTFILFIAILLSAVVWWIGPLVAIGSFHPLSGFWIRVVLVTLLLCWGLWPWVAMLLGWIMRHLRAPLPVANKTVARDRVSTRFFDAVHTLRHVALAQQTRMLDRWHCRLARRYLNDKPWFFVMGPPGCGKTSLIGGSGQRLLLAEQYGLPHTVDVGPTQDCNWWLTEQAVYIDTAGEWLQLQGQSEEAHQACSSLLKLLRRYRHYPAVDGIILCLDAHWLLQASLIERKSLADALRTRLLETASALRSHMPVYLAINQLDKLPGASRYLSMIDDQQLAQGLGIAVNASSLASQQFIEAETHFRQLAGRVSLQVLTLLQEVADSDIRQQLLFFTEALGALEKPLFNLLTQIFPATPVGYACQLRQISLGSSQMLPTYGQDYHQQTRGTVEHRDCGTLFSKGLHNAIIERGVLQKSGNLSLWHQYLPRLAGYFLVAVSLTVAGYQLVVRYWWEMDYISYTSARFKETQRIIREIPVTNRASDELVFAYEQLGYMYIPSLDESSPALNPYLEHRLINQATTQTYQRHLLKIFWPAVENYLRSELNRGMQSNQQDIYDTLRVYLMMGKPQYRSSDILINWFMQRWSQLVPKGYNDINPKVFRYHLQQMFASPDAPVMTIDDALVRQARIKSMTVPMQQRVVRRIAINPLPTTIENVSLADAAGPSVSLMLRRKSQLTVTDSAVPGFYTRASYRDIFLPQYERAAEQMIDEMGWVLADKMPNRSQAERLSAVQKLADEARKLYLLEYANHWERFMRDITIRPVSQLDDAAQLARQLADPSSPLSNLVRFAARELSLTGNSQGDVTSWLDKQRHQLEQKRRDILGEISGERSRFRLTPETALEDRFELLRRLGYQLLQANTQNSDPLARDFEALYNQLSTLSMSLRGGQSLSQQGALGQLRISAARQPEPVRSVMMDLLQVAESQSKQQSRQNLSKGAASLSSGLCKNTLSGRYPFLRNARAEVGIDDFTRMFARQGAMQNFFDQHLASYVDTDAEKWRARPGNQEMVSFSTLKAFENAALIRDTFFSSGDKLGFSMFLRPLSLTPTITEAVLDIDGQLVSYSHGYQESVRVDWPGPKGGSYVRLSFKTASGATQTLSFDGPWAIFRLYDASNSQPMGADRRELTLAMPSVAGILKMELRATMKDFPLWSRALKNFSCPKAI